MERASEILKRLQLPNVNGEQKESLDDEQESSCPVCRGANFVHPVEDGKVNFGRIVSCECQRERIIRKRLDAMIDLCNLPHNTEHMIFDKFKAYNKSLQEALTASMEVANPDGKINWLTLSGGVDTGKSHLAIAICREWLRRDQPAMYIGVSTLLDELRNSYNNEGGDSYDSKMFFYQNVPLLVLDDLGTERPNEWVFERLFQIINHRSENGLHLVVTTNLPVDRLRGDSEHRIASRLMRHRQGKIVVIDADEYRTKKGRVIR